MSDTFRGESTWLDDHGTCDVPRPYMTECMHGKSRIVDGTRDSIGNELGEEGIRCEYGS